MQIHEPDRTRGWRAGIVLVWTLTGCAATASAPPTPRALARALSAAAALDQDGGGRAAEPEREIDASQPTNLYTQLDVLGEYRSFGSGDTYGFRALPTFAPNPNNLFMAEIPVLYSDFDGLPSDGGVGDLRFRYFTVPFLRKPETQGFEMTAAGASLDVFAPTGDDKTGLGSGSWVLAPGVVGGWQVNERFSFYPILSYQLSLRDSNYSSSGPGAPNPKAPDDVTQGWSTEVISVLRLGEGQWVQITPKFASTVTGNVNESLNLRLQYGRMLRPNMALILGGVQEFLNTGALQTEIRAGLRLFL